MKATRGPVYWREHTVGSNAVVLHTRPCLDRDPSLQRRAAGATLDTYAETISYVGQEAKRAPVEFP